MNRISVADLERHHGARPIDQQILFLTPGRSLIRRASSFETLQPCDIPSRGNTGPIDLSELKRLTAQGKFPAMLRSNQRINFGSVTSSA
jgi:hypothetical protein